MTVSIITAVTVLGVGAYLAVCGLAPLPDPVVTFAQPTSVELPSDEAIVDAVESQLLPSATGWLGTSPEDMAEDNTDSFEGAIWTNDDGAYPMASLTKLVTALVGLEAEPLNPGDDGAVHIWDEDDVERQEVLLDLDGVAFPIPEGTEVTRSQMLTLMLIPSANDFAMSYAYSVFGGNDGFVQASEEWKERHGLSSLQVVEPSGMSADNVASPHDLVRITQLALANPVIAEIVASESAYLPWGIGEVANSNPLFGSMPGVIGVKTGYTDDAGYNLSAAAQSDTDGRTFTAIAVVLGRDSDEARAEDAEQLLTALVESPRTVTIVEQGEHTGVLRTVDGQESDFIADSDVAAVLAPGEIPRLHSLISADGASGSVIVTTPTGKIEVPIHIENAPAPPTFWWRITHPLTLFGSGSR